MAPGGQDEGESRRVRRRTQATPAPHARRGKHLGNTNNIKSFPSGPSGEKPFGLLVAQYLDRRIAATKERPKRLEEENRPSQAEETPSPAEEYDPLACAGCGVKAYGPWGAFAMGKRWCAKCFTCADCGKPLKDYIPFCVEGTSAYHPACWRRSCLPRVQPGRRPLGGCSRGGSGRGGE